MPAKFPFNNKSVSFRRNLRCTVFENAETFPDWKAVTCRVPVTGTLGVDCGVPVLVEQIEVAGRHCVCESKLSRQEGLKFWDLPNEQSFRKACETFRPCIASH